MYSGPQVSNEINAASHLQQKKICLYHHLTAKQTYTSAKTRDKASSWKTSTRSMFRIHHQAKQIKPAAI
uniref:Uncharacterized protein n=1 Tax=Setaria italica TaxID=4555 RepID=K3Y0N4_SETIT